ncbi:AAEL004638-PA [Aedes aegypti]|uniref:AAEL004638-PA n=1 Tax=Aedes aegypti TaxID=7159 RepID=Q17CC2_AEDAE|nr:AAEL004638-PA [Aedes aegypti]
MNIVVRDQIHAKLVADIVFIVNNQGGIQLSVNGFPYIRSKTNDDVQYWACSQAKVLGCSARASVRRREPGQKPAVKLSGCHNHLIITERRRHGESAMLKMARGRKVLPEKRQRQKRAPKE